MNTQSKIEITLVEYEQLLADQAMLNCLEATGVDNWDGYEIAKQMFDDGDYL